jgi:hypothetical protein
MAEDVHGLTRHTERDPLGTDAVRDLARAIHRAVNDPKMHPKIAMRVARVTWEGLLSRADLKELLDIVETKRRAKQLDSPGAYFVASIKRLFQRNDIPWREPKRGPDHDKSNLF